MRPSSIRSGATLRGLAMGACPMTDREHDNLLTAATDRFERRLSEEIGAVRVAMVEQDSATRKELIEQDSATRQEIAKLRVDMTEQFAAARIHTESRHQELL